MADHAGSEPVAAVRRALRLLEAAGEHEGDATGEQLAREAGIAPAEAGALLPMLVRDGYLTEPDDHTYALAGTASGPPAGHGAKELPGRVRPVLSALRDELSAASYLTLYEDGEIRIMEIADSARTPRVDLWVGVEEAGHATALGKSVLRELDEEARADYLSRHALTGLTPRTITHPDELIAQLDGSPAPVVMDREEYVRGTTCVAVPVYNGEQVGSLGISFRSDRMYRTTRVREGLLAAALRVSRDLSLPG
ncbi:IclR family transcriptional regulator C-terminal domain-containing protein [Streptomyces castrisilvae]|uniref:IclR family transcriptional regulator C-terminal domain-containing protein n=1 Tax=Streptomyces castrisilvae TaxID=3033811 RepID=A0ABY9HCH6_9ACTN|nr:IclR family transcriptional regulator C-terminal domain-containing protein [Streptomyces sp. Mut1]WLQ32207.1 IclR family transcriptional regulator C-terminal domain-containing protein [Streptomyces sp. Mut1]